MTYEQTKKANLHNAAPAMLKLLQHFSRTIGHNMHPNEQKAVELLIDKATCNSADYALMSEDFFNSLITDIVYH